MEVTKMDVKTIFNKFDHRSKYVRHTELKTGHINDTFLVKTESNQKYILQRINHHVFKNVAGLINNKVLISNHIRNKFPNISDEEFSQKNLRFLKATNTNQYYHKKDETYWNVMVYIDESITYEIAKNEETAYEGGKLLGDFLNLTGDFDSSLLIDVIPNFHDMSFRFKQYASSIQSAPKDRLRNALKYMEKVSELKEEMLILQNLKETKKIPLRVTHNDAKISNVLFDKENKGICMIDTDTVMPGIIHYDFGDAIRTICNTAAEDEQDLSKVQFNLEYYKAFKKGFLEKMHHTLSDTDLEYLPLAAKTMIFIMALRFLTDYLNHDIYYKVKYPDHNLDRAKNQLKLIERFSQKLVN